MSVKTLSLRIDDDLLTRIDEWGMAHLEDGEVRYNRNATLKRLLEMALAIPDQEELDDEGVEAATPSIGEMTLDDLLDRIEERQRKVASEGRAETVNQVLAGTKMLSDALYRDMSTAINAGNQEMVDNHLLGMGKGIEQLGEGVDRLAEAEEAREAKEAEREEPERKSLSYVSSWPVSCSTGFSACCIRLPVPYSA